jgi:hypothetical protein
LPWEPDRLRSAIAAQARQQQFLNISRHWDTPPDFRPEFHWRRCDERAGKRYHLQIVVEMVPAPAIRQRLGGGERPNQRYAKNTLAGACV